MMPIKKLTQLMLLGAVAVSGACLDANGPEATPIEKTKFATSLGVDLAASTKTPFGAYYRDMVQGTGPVVEVGQTLSVRYTGWLSNGTQFDSNVTNPDPLSFKLGAHEVIAGFDEALVGVKVGAKRQLIIPPSLGYGPYDYGPIPGNSVLVFNVEVISSP
jgi:FKBP-type peptidyl-prolyl cis-trans isomerase FkpA